MVQRPWQGRHELAEMIVAAAGGAPPTADGSWRRVPPWRHGLEAVVAFTGHAVLAVAEDVVDADLRKLGVDGFGGAHHPRVISTLAGADGWIDSLDLLMTRHGAAGQGSGDALVDRPDLASHPRALHAASVRDDIKVLGYVNATRSAVVVLSRGVAGLPEVSFELEQECRGVGAGSRMVLEALTAVPADQLVVAAVAPGNVASVRTLLTAGFRPTASIQLFRRQPESRDPDQQVDARPTVR